MKEILQPVCQNTKLFCSPRFPLKPGKGGGGGLRKSVQSDERRSKQIEIHLWKLVVMPLKISLQRTFQVCVADNALHMLYWNGLTKFLIAEKGSCTSFWNGCDLASLAMFIWSLRGIKYNNLPVLHQMIKDKWTSQTAPCFKQILALSFEKGLPTVKLTSLALTAWFPCERPQDDNQGKNQHADKWSWAKLQSNNLLEVVLVKVEWALAHKKKCKESSRGSNCISQ